jgi:very-short-patch-repair endonuclease
VFGLIGYTIFFSLIAAVYFYYILSPDPQPIRELNQSLLVSERNKCESPIERRLYDALAFRGYAVTSQVPCGKYRIDLALIGPRIAIECDGKAYHSTPKAKARDRRKDKYLKDNGWRVLRFSGRMITRDLGKVLQRIETEIPK